MILKFNEIDTERQSTADCLQKFCKQFTTVSALKTVHTSFQNCTSFRGIAHEFRSVFFAIFCKNYSNKWSMCFHTKNSHATAKMVKIGCFSRAETPFYSPQKTQAIIGLFFGGFKFAKQICNANLQKICKQIFACIAKNLIKFFARAKFFKFFARKRTYLLLLTRARGVARAKIIFVKKLYT